MQKTSQSGLNKLTVSTCTQCGLAFAEKNIGMKRTTLQPIGRCTSLLKIDGIPANWKLRAQAPIR